MAKKHTAVSKARKQNQSTVQPPPPPTDVTGFIEPKHADDEPIYKKYFPWKDLIPNWDKFDPNYKNPVTQSVFGSGHHVPGPGGSGKTNADFEKFIFKFCLEHRKDDDGNYTKDRCLNQFTIKSAGQCISHTKPLQRRNRIASGKPWQTTAQDTGAD